VTVHKLDNRRRGQCVTPEPSLSRAVEYRQTAFLFNRI
jgi:hypothetical protein